jgi:uncharacterized C2H2 Zn-finger protein
MVMGLWSIFRKIDRKHWFVCSTCMQRTDHDTLISVFYSKRAPEIILGRQLMRCPRCGTANTRSFEDIKNEGSEAALWGLERTVRKHPRSRFDVKPSQPASLPREASRS